MLHKTLERLDGAASTLVPLLYLLGLMAGTLAYFADLRMGFTLAVGVALAGAAELHSFLQQRRARDILASEPDISTRKLAKRLSVGRAYQCHPQRAGTIRLRIAGEDGASQGASSTASQGARVGA